MPRVPGTKTRRNAELGLLALAMVLVAAYGAIVEANQLDKITAELLGAGRRCSARCSSACTWWSASPRRTPTRC